MQIFHVDKVRIGFACNSSSTHSLVMLPEHISLSDDIPVEWGELSYGWGAFTLTSREAKAAYVISQMIYLACNELRLGVSAYEIAGDDSRYDAARKKVFRFINRTLKSAGVTYRAEYDNSMVGYIDHQSVWEWPRNWTGSGINLEWIGAIFDNFVDNPHTAVLGGNDNGGEHPLVRENPEIKEFSLANGWGYAFVARPEPGHNHWTLFDRNTGSKVRMRMDASGERLLRAHAPELVDVKITDHCPYPGTRGQTCLSCYQGSLPTGTHAPIENIALIAERLGSERVLEVALGGGEPTLHPQLLEIVKAFRDQHIIPNITTRNWRFIEGTDFTQVHDLLGGIAFSVDSVEDVRRVRRVLTDRDSRPYVRQPRLSVQVVMGTMPLSEVEAILREARGERADGTREGVWLPVTLLGFKRTGRGESGPAHPYTGWTHMARRASRWGIGIDTALARESFMEINALLGQLAFYMVEHAEGAFSMYVNGMNMQMSQSSYETEGAVPFDEEWVERFQTWEPTGSLPEMAGRWR